MDSSETQEEINRQQLDYIREGNVGEGSMQDEAATGNGQNDNGGGGGGSNGNTKKQTPGSVKAKTTEQLAKTAFWLQLDRDRAS